MAENNTGGWSAHWTALIAILIAAGGAFFHVSPLNSSRPTATASKRVDLLGYQDVEARLWQDPFQAAKSDEEERERAATQPSPPAPGDDQPPVAPPSNDKETPAAAKPSPSGSPKPSAAPSSDSEAPAAATKRELSGSSTTNPATRPIAVDKEGPSHRWRDFIKQFTDRTCLGSHVTVMPVMVQAGSYAELGEQRLRLRVAVLDALMLQDFVPEDAEHIGRVTVGWEWQAFTCPTVDQPQIARAMDWYSGASRLLIPYEWCHRKVVKGTPAEKFTRDDVLILWLNENAFSDLPLTRLGALCAKIREIRKFGSGKVTFKVIGPRVSTVMRAMAQEAAQGLHVDTIAALSDVDMFCPTATAAEELLLEDLKPADPQPSKLETVSELIDFRLNRSRSSPPFLQRTTLTDSELCRDVIDELERYNGVRVKWRKKPVDSSQKRPAQTQVALVCEWDTFFARSLVRTFEKHANDSNSGRPDWLHTRYYLRGIDGQIPAMERHEQYGYGEQPKTTEKGDKPAASLERPEGMSGMDYLRRIADDLAALDKRLKAEAGGAAGSGIQIVGVLGDDVYDKLLVLRAVRDRLPNVQFFTESMDARYSLPGEWGTAHNLLISSTYGLQLNPDFQGSMPPFRDASQTAAFASVQFAMSKPGDLIYQGLPAWVKPSNSARLFTIGRHGAVDLSIADNPLHPSREKSLQWVKTRASLIFWSCIALAFLFLMPILFGVRPTRVRFSTALNKTVPFLILAIPVIFLIVLLLNTMDARYNSYKGEPFAWADGVSIWPTEMVRLLVVALCIHFFLNIRQVVEENEAFIEKEFRLLPLPRPGTTWTPDAEHPEPENMINALSEPGFPISPGSKWWERMLHFIQEYLRRLRLSNWHVYGPADTSKIARNWARRVPASVKSEGGVDLSGESTLKVFAQNLWWEYKRRSGGHRYVRVVIMSALYIFASACLAYLLGVPRSPARNSFAQSWDSFILIVAVFSSILLTFFVLDSTYLNKRFIEHLMKQGTQWPQGVFDKAKFAQTKLGLELTEYIDIQFIAARTEAVGDIIYYPFAIFFLMLVSRNSFFDNWDWPAGLILVVAGNIALAIIGTLMLRGAAETARKRALNDLNQRRRKFLADDDHTKADSVEELIKDVEGESRGAFSLLSQHPFLAAVLLPSGSIGVWVLLEYLAHTLG